MEIESIKRLDVRPGERLVVKIKASMSQQQRANIRESIKQFVPEATVIVVPDTVEFAVLPETE
jgi:hypothetical protein